VCGDRQSKEPTLVVFAQSRKRRSESTRGPLRFRSATLDDTPLALSAAFFALRLSFS
jgi:hypothetical protein